MPTGRSGSDTPRTSRRRSLRRGSLGSATCTCIYAGQRIWVSVARLRAGDLHGLAGRRVKPRTAGLTGSGGSAMSRLRTDVRVRPSDRANGKASCFPQRYLGLIAMAYQATIIPVMIASPSDVEHERQIVREVLHDWNNVHSKSRKTAFMPVAWETHAPPGLDGRPQEIINKHLLEDCDLLVGVFWTRIGTPTGAEQSGTVEEIKTHHGAGKPVMLYFSSTPVSPGKIDSEQFSKVQHFKTWSKNQGLIEEYGSVEEFREKLTRHLQLTLEQNKHLQRILGEPSPIGPDLDRIAFPETPLSTDAQALLLAASEEKAGTIIALNTTDGYSVQAGQKAFGGGYGRESARWKNALEELEEYDYVQDRGYRGQVFELTHTGWNEADRIRTVGNETDETTA